MKQNNLIKGKALKRKVVVHKAVLISVVGEHVTEASQQTLSSTLTSIIT